MLKDRFNAFGAVSLVLVQSALLASYSSSLFESSPFARKLI